ITRDTLWHAVDTWKVNIIVISFGFTKSIAEIHQEIQRAAQHGVLVFAAASNGGNNEGIAWPAREDNVICVHSADGHGNRSPFTPIAEGNSRLMTLGECVSSSWPPKLNSSQPGRQVMSGTSCAAPIAAAIAAIVLDYARDFLSDTEWAGLCRASAMRRMLEGISQNKVHHGGYCWIRHWKLFDLSRTAEGIKDEIRRYAV
ncbi:pfs domain-containing protein, partial [Colletotrichum filicis]